MVLVCRQVRLAVLVDCFRTSFSRPRSSVNDSLLQTLRLRIEEYPKKAKGTTFEYFIVLPFPRNRPEEPSKLYGTSSGFFGTDVKKFRKKNILYLLLKFSLIREAFSEHKRLPWYFLHSRFSLKTP